MSKVFFYTLGCRVNKYETEFLSEELLKKGFTISSDENDADIYIVNSCSVTGVADRKTRKYARRGKRFNPNAKVIVIGCSVTVQKDALEKIEEIDFLIPEKDKMKLPKILQELFLEEKKLLKNNGDSSSLNDAVGPLRRKKFFIKIQNGCDNFCTYCIIPFARGLPTSRPKTEILGEIETALKQGHSEIVITGINIAKYDELDDGSGLIDLCKKINALHYDFKFALSSLEPTICKIDFFKELIKLDKLKSEFHISAQSFSDRILKKMGRNYSAKDFLEIINFLRDKVPGTKISTDIIVGFPGETEEDFEATESLCKKIKFSHIHIFKYSKREGTKAAEMPYQVPEQVKTARSKILAKYNYRYEE